MVIALDIETKNLSTEIGGWGNTHMFLVSTVATWDGTIGKIYVEKEITDKIVAKSNVQVLPLRQLKYDLDDIHKSGEKLLGHNIVAFDLPVLRDSLDIYCIRKFLNDKQYIDTSKEITKQHGERIRLQNLVETQMRVIYFFIFFISTIMKDIMGSFISFVKACKEALNCQVECLFKSNYGRKAMRSFQIFGKGYFMNTMLF